MQAVYRAQIFASAIGDRIRLLLRPCKAKSGGGGQAIDEESFVGRNVRVLGVLYDLVEVCLAVGGGCRQGRIKAAENTREITTLFPPPRTHACDRKIGDGAVPCLDVDEQS